MNPSHIWYFHMSVHVSSLGTSDNRKGQCLMNTVDQVEFPN